MSGKHEVMWMFHSTAMVDDYVRARDWLAKFAGLRVLHDTVEEHPGIARRGGMVWIGDNSLELGQPIIPGTAAWRFLERFGPGMHSIALQVADIEATIAFLAERGVAAPSRPAPHFVLTDPRATDGILFEWFATAQRDDPRFGVALPPPLLTPLLEAPQYAFTGVVVPEPRRVAEHFAELMGTAITFEDPDAGPGRPEAGVSTNDSTIALYRLPAPEESRRLWGAAYDRARVHLMALRVPDLGEAEEVLRREGVGLLRRDDGILDPRPDQTGNLQVALTDRLLPNDPRLAR
jgi:methylmalonyl-CoA/ethylmalonyl-CoA epimerase